MNIDHFKDRLKTAGVLYIDLYPYIIEGDGSVKYLVLKRRDGVELARTWQTISGKIKKNETIKDSFWRLAVERTGQIPDHIFSVDYVNTYYDNYYDTIMLTPVAACKLKKNEIILSELHTDFEWLSLEDACETLIWPNQHTSLKLIDKMINQKIISEFHYLKKS